jgi:hypothetical protein
MEPGGVPIVKNRKIFLENMHSGYPILNAQIQILENKVKNAKVLKVIQPGSLKMEALHEECSHYKNLQTIQTALHRERNNPGV